jgi:hypothetical protein
VQRRIRRLQCQRRGWLRDQCRDQYEQLRNLRQSMRRRQRNRQLLLRGSVRNQLVQRRIRRLQCQRRGWLRDQYRDQHEQLRNLRQGVFRGPDVLRWRVPLIITLRASNLAGFHCLRVPRGELADTNGDDDVYSAG